MIDHGSADHEQRTALLRAAETGHADLVQQLLTQGVPADACDPDQKTALMLAAERGHTSVARVLLDAGACIDAQSKPEQATALLLATKSSDLAMTELLIERGASIDMMDETEMTPLMLAIQNGDSAVARLLMNHGAALETETHAALLVAAEGGHDELVEELIGRGADVDTRDKDGETALRMAAKSGREGTVNLLLRQGASVNATTNTKRTALMMAAGEGFDTITKILIDHGADVNAVNSIKCTALMYAAQDGYDKVVQMLLDHEADVNAEDEEKYTSLTLAAQFDHVEVVRMLIDHGADVNAEDDTKYTPLIWAAQEGHVEVVRVLIDYGADVNAENDAKYTSLMMASEKGHVEVVRTLIDHGANVNAKSNTQHPPLTIAAEEGHDEVVLELIEHGANVNGEVWEEYTPLMKAAYFGYDKVVRVLIDHGADVNAKNVTKHFPLIWAAQEGHVEVVRMLIDHGADVNAKNLKKVTPLQMASQNGHVEIVRMLINHGADVKAEDDTKFTPLIYAAQQGHVEVGQILIDHGVDINAEDDTKHTPLIWASQNGQGHVVRMLIDRGALIDARDDKNHSALMIAASEGHTETVKILLAAGSSIEAKNNDEETALMIAVDNNHQAVVCELLNKDVEMSGAMELLKLGLQKRKLDAAEKAKAKEMAKAQVKIDDLVQLCSKMNEAQAISERIYSRLVDVEKELATLSELIRQEATPRLKQLVEKTHGFMSKHADKHTVTRLVGSQVMIDTSRDLNRELDALLLQFDIPGAESGVHDWKAQWDIDATAMKSFLKESLKKKDVLLGELQDPTAQTEALTLLMFECSSNASQYSDEEMALINELFQYVSSMSRLEIPAVPKWFVPPHEVQFNAKSSFAGGSYGSVHYGTWNGTAVVVKSAFMEDDKSREMFLNETEIWSKLQHPHIVTLFRACHVGNPFFVCDLASNGTLSEYLYRDKNHFETWSKLHEAALGLQYLHTKQKVVHGDLKCNNILISADGKAKLTDFGLSFVLTDREEEASEETISGSHEVGAIRWKAPEVMKCSTRGTFASDVYSLGMCIVEAVTGRVPWGMMPDVAVKHKTLTQKELPKQPPSMNDTQWDLVKRMCAWDPVDRIEIREVVKNLWELAEEELDLKMEAEWAEDDEADDEPTAEPNPVT